MTPRLLAAVALATAALSALGRICIDIAAEIDEMCTDYRVEIPADFLEELAE